MALYDQPNMTEGIDEVMVDIAQGVPEFATGLCLFVFFVVFLTGMAAQRRRQGYADTSVWAMLAAMSTLFIALLMSLKEGLMNPLILSVVFAATVMISVWYFLSKGRGEV